MNGIAKRGSGHESDADPTPVRVRLFRDYGHFSSGAIGDVCEPMTVQLAISLTTLAFAIVSAIVLYSWKGGEWTGGERRHSEDVERRMDQANEEMSKLASTVQSLMGMKESVAVLTERHEHLKSDLARIDLRVNALERQK